MLIESNELREELKHPVWAENWTPDYEMACRETFDNVERCIQRAEEKQRCRNEVEKAQEDVVAWRIKEAVMAVLTNDEVKRPIIDHYYELTHRTVKLETMPIKDVPIGGIVLGKTYDGGVDIYVKTAERVDDEVFQLRVVDSTSNLTKYMPYNFLGNAQLVYTGIIMKEWETWI